MKIFLLVFLHSAPGVTTPVICEYDSVSMACEQMTKVKDSVVVGIEQERGLHMVGVVCPSSAAARDSLNRLDSK